MIIKYVHENDIICTHYDDVKSFLKDCYDPTFKDKYDNSRDVILLENDGIIHSFDTLKEAYASCVNTYMQHLLA